VVVGTENVVLFFVDDVSLYTEDTEVLGRVQKAATNLLPQFRKCSYPARLKKIGITSLKDRRLR